MRAHIACVLLGLAACSDETPRSANVVPVDGGAPSFDAGSLPDAATAIALPFSITDEPDAPCTPFAGTPVTVHPSHVPFAVLGRVGARRFAASDLAPGIALFDLDGKNAAPDLSFGDLDVAAGGADLLVSTAEESAVSSRRFDPNGAAIGGSSTIASERVDTIALARSAEGALAVWSTFDKVRARPLGTDGVPTGDAIDLETPQPKSAFSASIAADPAGGFVVAWSDVGGPSSRTRLFTARVRKGAVLGLVHRLAEGDVPLRLVQLVQRPSGFVLLASTLGTPLVILLDPLGRLAAPAKKLLGATGTFGVATSKNAVGVLAFREATHVYRPLDATGKPSAQWTCLGPAKPGGSPAGAFDADESDGFAALVPGAASESLLYRFDPKGAPR